MFSHCNKRRNFGDLPHGVLEGLDDVQHRSVVVVDGNRRHMLEKQKPSSPRRPKCQHIHSWPCQHAKKHDETRCQICFWTAKQGHRICWPTQCFSQHERHLGNSRSVHGNQRGYAPVHHEGFFINKIGPSEGLGKTSELRSVVAARSGT